MCAQTRPRFILSSEGVFWGMEFEPMLTPREKSPLLENVPRGGSNPRRCGQRAQTLPTELFRPPVSVSAQDGIVVVGKAHARSTPYLSSLSKVALRTVPVFVWLNTDRSQSWRVECQLPPFSTPLSFRSSVL